MARNAEKAQTILNRYWAAKQGKVSEQRPFVASECDDLVKAEKWRRQIIGEISQKISQIQNTRLDEFRIRDLNDSINKLNREKFHWEIRIFELGGTNYNSSAQSSGENTGSEIYGNRGYKYYGRAKDLPGVKPLFQTAPPKVLRKTRPELSRKIDAEYYGYKDDNDETLVSKENYQETIAISNFVKNWMENKDNELSKEMSENIYINRSENDNDLTDMPSESSKNSSEIFNYQVPDQEDIELALLLVKKKEMLLKYTSELLQAQQDEARTLLGFLK